MQVTQNEINTALLQVDQKHGEPLSAVSTV